MNRIAKFLALAVFAGVLGSAANASAGNNELVTPLNVGCFESGECFIVLAAPLVQATGCANPNQVRFLTTQPGADAMYKAALSAFLSGKKLIVDPNTGLCQSGFPRPLYLYITN